MSFVALCKVAKRLRGGWEGAQEKQLPIASTITSFGSFQLLSLE